VVQRLFDATIEEVEPAAVGAQVWAPEVRLFEVSRNGSPVGYFYLDSFTRPGEKKGGAWMNGVINRSRALAPPGEAVRLPVAILCCNQSPPVTNPNGSITPSLMTFANCTTLFHETGHGLQHMLTKVDEGHVSGISGVEWDAVEQPSQFMEYWVLQPEVLSTMARHWQTGEPMPEALISRIRAAKTFRAASAMCRQLEFAMTDLALHGTDVAPSKGKTVFDVHHGVASRTSALPFLPANRFLCGFSHIFSGGYAAGYFSYKWAEVLSAEGFAAFEEAGLDDDESVRQLGRRYADTVLGLGGSRPAAEVFELFRGRPPSPDALLKHNNLLPAAAAAA